VERGERNAAILNLRTVARVLRLPPPELLAEGPNGPGGLAPLVSAGGRLARSVGRRVGATAGAAASYERIGKTGQKKLATG
jgi:hypothetical protein